MAHIFILSYRSRRVARAALALARSVNERRMNNLSRGSARVVYLPAAATLTPSLTLLFFHTLVRILQEYVSEANFNTTKVALIARFFMQA